MCFFRKKTPQKKSVLENSDQVFLYRGAFYFPPTGKETGQTFTLLPGDVLDADVFMALAFACMEVLFSGRPVVLNELMISRSDGIRKDPCVQDYFVRGGDPVIPNERSLFTVSRGMDALLADCILQGGSGGLALSLYEYRPNESGRYAHGLTAHYREEHQYLEVTAPEDLNRHMETMRKLCAERGVELRVLDGANREN